MVVLTNPASVIQTPRQLPEKSVSHHNRLLLCPCVLGFPSCSFLGLEILGALGIPEVWMQVKSAVLHGSLYPEQEEGKHSCISGRGEFEFHENSVLTQIKPYLDVINTRAHLLKCSWVCLLLFLPWIQCPFVLAATLDLFLIECIFEITLIEVIICSPGLLLHGNCSTAFSKLQLVEV